MLWVVFVFLCVCLWLPSSYGFRYESEISDPDSYPIMISFVFDLSARCGLISYLYGLKLEYRTTLCDQALLSETWVERLPVLLLLFLLYFRSKPKT